MSPARTSASLRASSWPGILRPRSSRTHGTAPSRSRRCSTINSRAPSLIGQPLRSRADLPHARAERLEAVVRVESLGGADAGEMLSRQPDLDACHALLAGEREQRAQQLAADGATAPGGIHPQVLDQRVAPGYVQRRLPTRAEH